MKTDLRVFSAWGTIQGGHCEVDDDDMVDGQPLHGGFCLCDSIRHGHP